MNLIYLELNASAGTETVTRACLPLFAQRCRKVVYASHNHRIQQLRRNGTLAPGDGVEVAPIDFSAPGYGGIWRQASRVGRRARPRSLGRRIERMAADGWLRSLATKHRADACFAPWIFDVEPPRGLPCRMYSMAMDLLWRRHPEEFPAGAEAQLDARFQAWLELSERVFPVSEASASEMRKAFPGQAPKISAVPHGSGGPRPQLWTGAEGRARTRFFYPATMTSNKNHAALLRACGELWSQGVDFELQLAGRWTGELLGDAPPSRANVLECWEWLRRRQDLVAGRLIAPGFISDEALDRSFRECDAVVLPSLYEGFGLPLVEAFERGAPVICSDIPPFMEQIARFKFEGDVVTFPAKDTSALAEAMRAFAARGRRPTLDKAEIAQRLASWTWTMAVEQYLAEMQRN